MTFFKFEGNWKTRSANSFSITIEFRLALAEFLAVLPLLLG